MAEQPKNLIQEEDIGSGEKGKGQSDTQKMIEQVPVQNATQNSQQEQGQDKQGQSGNQASAAQQGNQQSAHAGHPHREREPAPQPAHLRGQELSEDLKKSLVDTTNTGVPTKGN